MKHYIRTYTGIKFDPLDPDPTLIDIEDIAHALSNVCRFTGHTRQFYSVAEHCYRVSDNCSEPNKLWGLLHDASEAYIADIASPIKHSECFALYREAEERLMRAVAVRFSLPWPIPEEVHQVDKMLLRTEQRDLMEVETEGTTLPETIEPSGPLRAELDFLLVFHSMGDD